MFNINSYIIIFLIFLFSLISYEIFNFFQSNYDPISINDSTLYGTYSQNLISFMKYGLWNGKAINFIEIFNGNLILLNLNIWISAFFTYSIGNKLIVVYLINSILLSFIFFQVIAFYKNIYDSIPSKTLFIIPFLIFLLFPSTSHVLYVFGKDLYVLLFSLILINLMISTCDNKIILSKEYYLRILGLIVFFLFSSILNLRLIKKNIFNYELLRNTFLMSSLFSILIFLSLFLNLTNLLFILVFIFLISIKSFLKKIYML